jgi:ABC-type phosphate transport system permease subunit
LSPDQEYAYTVRARIIVAGREEAETMQVKVIPGEINRASFEKLFAQVETATKSVAGANHR